VRGVVRQWVESTIQAHTADPKSDLRFQTAPVRFGGCPVALPPSRLSDVLGTGTGAYDAYGALADRQCQNLKTTMDAWLKSGAPGATVNEATILLYHGAAQACLLGWQGASSDLDRLNGLGGAKGFSCPEGVVYQWMKAMLAAHAALPQATPTFSTDNAARPLPCPTTTSSP